MKAPIAFVGALLCACGEPAICPIDLGQDIEQFTVDGYNDAVRNTGGGSNVNVTWNCPSGGTATITGSANTQTVTYNLVFTFHACGDGTLTLDGPVNDQVSNGGSSSTKVETMHSDALKIHGTSIGCNADPIDATCVVDITSSTSSICGLTN